MKYIKKRLLRIELCFLQSKNFTSRHMPEISCKRLIEETN